MRLLYATRAYLNWLLLEQEVKTGEKIWVSHMVADRPEISVIYTHIQLSLLQIL